MDDLSDLGLDFGSVNSFDDLDLSMDNITGLSAINDQTQAAASLDTWIFSPISNADDATTDNQSSGDTNNVQNGTVNPPKSTNQPLVLDPNQPMKNALTIQTEVINPSGTNSALENETNQQSSCINNGPPKSTNQQLVLDPYQPMKNAVTRQNGTVNPSGTNSAQPNLINQQSSCMNNATPKSTNQQLALDPYPPMNNALTRQNGTVYPSGTNSAQPNLINQQSSCMNNATPKSTNQQLALDPYQPMNNALTRQNGTVYPSGTNSAQPNLINQQSSCMNNATPKSTNQQLAPDPYQPMKNALTRQNGTVYPSGTNSAQPNLINQQSSCMNNATPKSTNQQRALNPYQPMKNALTINSMNQPRQQTKFDINNRQYDYASYMYPSNAFNYHQSVNIHNYMGNYGCMGQQQMWNPNMIYQVPSHNQPCPVKRYDPTPQATPQMPPDNDPLDNLNTADLEFTRCSTPEFLKALTSLKQMDSPPKPIHAAATNANYTASSFNQSGPEKSTKTLQSIQDSGYNSDLNASPVIQYQDNSAKPRHNQVKSTPPPPVLRLTNLATMNQENVPPMATPTPPNQHQSMNKPVLFPNNSQDNSMLRTESDVNYTNMAEYQLSKKTKARKRKTLDEDQTEKRHRLNEPLNAEAHALMSTWYEENIANPYPNKSQKQEFAVRGGITLSQVNSWFANKRNRSNNTKPKKQLMMMEKQLMNICHQLARDASKPVKDNAYYIQQLSSIMNKQGYSWK